MAVSKVIYGGETLVDLTSDTVTANDLAEGVTATAADGTQITGLLPKVEIDTALSTTSTNPVQNKVIATALAGKQATGNYVTYTANANITAGKLSGTTYTYGQSPIVVSNGIIIGGTAANAGLVTRGICGASPPDETTGACTTDHLYINYDSGSSAYSRVMILGAGSTGNAITTSTASSTTANSKYGNMYTAIRGDQMVNYVTDKLANYKVTVDSALSSTSTNPVQNKVINAALDAKADTDDILVTVGDYTAITGRENLVVIDPDGEDAYISEVDIVKSYADKAAESASSAKGYNDNITTTISTVTSKVDSAVSTANTANSNSTAALSTATTAQSTAESAQTTASSAETKAESALEKVDTQVLVDMFYPVGSVYMTTSDTLPAFMSYGTWEEIASDRVLQGASSSHKAGSTVAAGLPNITGSTAWGVNGLVEAYSSQSTAYSSSSGALSVAKDGKAYGAIGSSGSDSAASNVKVSINASKSNSIYGASTTVQPPAYIVHIYKRTA